MNQDLSVISDLVRQYEINVIKINRLNESLLYINSIYNMFIDSIKSELYRNYQSIMSKKHYIEDEQENIINTICHVITYQRYHITSHN